MAAAIVAAALERGAAVHEPSDLNSVTGKGVTGEVDGRAIVLGNAKLMADHGVPLGALEVTADEFRRDGATALFLP